MKINKSTRHTTKDVKSMPKRAKGMMSEIKKAHVSACGNCKGGY